MARLVQWEKRAQLVQRDLQGPLVRPVMPVQRVPQVQSVKPAQSVQRVKLVRPEILVQQDQRGRLWTSVDAR